MSFMLHPRRGSDIQVNAWLWRPTLEVLGAEDLLSERQAELLGCNACGATVSEELALAFAEVLGARLSQMRPGERIRADLLVTAEPLPAILFRPGLCADVPAVELYSASYDWLVRFTEFCSACGGFEVI